MLTDKEIAAHLSELKPITRSQIETLLKPKRSRRKRSRRDKRASVEIRGERGSKFVLFTRRNEDNAFNPHDFSVGLLYVPPGWSAIILARFNGWHAKHDNQVEKRAKSGVQTVPANVFHIHILTERYQRESRGENYAEQTDEYNSFDGAVRFMAESYGFYVSDDPYGRGSLHPLFSEGKS